MQYKSYLAVIAGAALWGSIGIFVRLISNCGVPPLGVVSLRCVAAGILFALYLAGTNPKLFQIRPKDIWIFIGSGFLALAGFNYCNFTCITLGSLAVAALLMYTAPVFVMLLSVLCFGERLTGNKILALLLTCAGCTLITGVLEEDILLNLPVIGYGLASGIGYALYSVFSKLALIRGYAPATVTFYTFAFGALACVSMAGLPLRQLQGSGWLGLAGLALVCSFGANLLFTQGLANIDAGHASVLATVEPLVAALIGCLCFGETLSLLKCLGVALICTAVWMAGRKNAER